MADVLVVGAGRIASPEMLPRSGVLPHSNCSPAVQPVLHRRERIWGTSVWRHGMSWWLR